MEFRVLGPVEVLEDGTQLAVGHAKQRAVLAVLVLELNRVVPTDRLVDRVWGDEPPASARNLIHGYVGKLRSALGTASADCARVARRAGGYVLEAASEQVDLFRFRRNVTEAGVGGSDAASLRLLREALALWRGDAVSGLSSPWLSGMRETLSQERLSALLNLNDIELRLGQHAELAARLAAEVTEHPADERLVAQLMLALYRSGRQAEALRFFERTRRELDAELGASPGSELRKLHQQILRDDPELSLSREIGRALPVPRQLPVAVACFTGRDAELTALTGLLEEHSGVPAPAMVISAIGGTAGVGKTALAVQWAHQVAERFPDGQLYVNLRGYDPDEPVSAADALAGFLRTLGVPSTDIPEETEERARLYRSTMAARHFLVLLDNARDSEQVRPLLPGGSGCVALVTSRDALAGLVARDGARRLALDLLPLLDAVELLRTLIGDRVSADPEAAGILARQCARLPLALRVAAELAVARPAMPVGELARELAERSGRLDLLDAGGDVRTAVRAVFWSSYRHLDSADARLFRLAGLHPGPDFSIHAAAALAGRDLPAVGHALERLTRAHLVHRIPGRYGLHDLLHEYARELAAEDDAEHNRAATMRVLDYYLNGATAATDIIFPAEPRTPGPLASPPGIPPMADATAARSWLNGEMACLVRVTGFAADSGWHSHATRLALVLFRHLEVSGRYAEGEIIFCHALRAATVAGDHDAEADALTNMGLVDLRRGRNQRASIRLQDALGIYRALGDRRGMSRVLNNLGIVAIQQGRYDEAAAHIGESIDHYQAAGDRDREARATYNLGFVRLQQCRYDEAARHLTDALRRHEKNGTLPGVARALRSLGAVELRQGDVDQACSRLQEALRLSREIGDRAGEPYVLADLGLAALKQEQHERAVARYEQALAMLSELGDRPGEAAARNGLGEALRASGDPSGGRTHHFRALSMATEIGEKSEQARAHDGLGHCYLAEGEAESARQHWREALRLYCATGVPTAEIVRVQLASLS